MSYIVFWKCYFSLHTVLPRLPSFTCSCTSFSPTGYNILLCEYTILCLATFLLIDVSIVYDLWLLPTVLPWESWSRVTMFVCDLLSKRGVALLETLCVRYECFNGYTIGITLWNNFKVCKMIPNCFPEHCYIHTNNFYNF